jgi:fructose-specific component phosphotransferase system IIB-like protein
MKQKLSGFIAGVVATATIASLMVAALATTGQFSITVNPINVQVNGETFQPKDVNGKNVPVFNYDGTTYAPLRALAEAYGLEVGYNAEKNMATVGEKGNNTTAPSTDYSDWTAEEEAAYQEFKAMWDVAHYDQSNISIPQIMFVYNGYKNLDSNTLKEYLNSHIHFTIRNGVESYKEIKNKDLRWLGYLDTDMNVLWQEIRSKF